MVPRWGKGGGLVTIKENMGQYLKISETTESEKLKFTRKLPDIAQNQVC
jgi:hypothetical protein